MKNLFLISLICFVTIVSGFSQVPNAFNYQAVVRNSLGEIIANSNISFRISILKNSETGTLVYVETHSALTDNFGLTSLKIGKGIPVSGVFNPSDWGAALHFIRVEVDPAGGNSYIQMGTYQLLSVPYAFHAQTVAEDKVDDADSDPNNEIQSLQINGTQLSLSNGGGTVAIPSSADNWGTQTVTSDATLSGVGTTINPLKVANNAIQPNWANIQDKPGGFADNNDDVEDGDANPNNEIQTLSISGNDLSISDGNTVTLPASPWESSGNDIFFNSGNVGIGTSSLMHSFTINGQESNTYINLQPGTSGNVSKNGLILGINAGTNASFLWNYANAGMGFATNDIQRMLITAEGNVGIGTDNPVEKLHIQNGGIQVDQGYGFKMLNSNLFSEIKSSGNDLDILSYSGGDINFYTSLIGNSAFIRMLIKNDGKVGIGTVNPNEDLHVNGNIKLENGYLLFTRQNYISSIYTSGRNIGISNAAQGGIEFTTSPTQGSLILQAIIDKNGNFGIGTSSPEQLLHITGTNPRILIEASSSNPEINFKNTGDVSTSIWSIYKNGSNGDLHFYQNGNKLTLQKNTGNVGIGTTTPQGKLDVNGSIYQRGGTLHADYVFEEDYQLESIEEHAEFMWENKHLPAIPKATADENGFEIVEVGSHRKGIVEELEKAHIYISQLEKAIEKQNLIIGELKAKAENSDLTIRMEKLEKIVGDLEAANK